MISDLVKKMDRKLTKSIKQLERGSSQIEIKPTPRVLLNLDLRPTMIEDKP